MKKILFFLISLFIGIGLLVWVIRFVGWQEIKSAFSIFAAGPGIIILLLTALMLLTGVWKWQIILKSLGYNLSNRQLVPPYLACFSLTYFFPMVILGGELFRGYHLRENHSVPWGKAISSVIIDKILEATAFLLTIFAGLIFFLLKIGLPPKNLGIILGGVLIFLSVGIGFFYFKIFKRESIAKFFAKIFNKKLPNHESLLEIEGEIFNFFRFKKRVMWQGFSLAFLRVAVTWLRTWILILFLGKTIGALTALPILGFYYLVLMIPIPAALGSHEIIQTFSFGALGLGAGAAPVFTMIQRGAELILAFIGIVIFLKLGMGLLRTVLFRKIENLINNKNNHIQPLP